ncbi:M14 family metallopeptidase [Paucihalobacter sp.]|uniref:M14 family metallopeptidase n=1 Tax=Paucihalobacter sp. TaxID=2850405 RepID=UPI002FE10F8A
MRILITIFCFISCHAFSQTNFDLNYYLPQNISYNPNVPKPREVIGHEVGKWHVTHDKLVQYMYAVANASDRISIENRGFTFEDRPLLLLTVSAPKNLNNLENIKQEHIAATDNDTQDFNRPTVVYQGFSIHGNEPSGSNAALVLAYYLAAAQGEAIDNLLENTVILLDPSFNPDGLQRFAYWANTNKNINLTADSNDREYSEIWPGGRTNHYYFDMNRDWLPVQLPESRARLKTYHQWLPNILTDHHEMGTNSTFFFQPGIPSRTHPLTPQKNQDLTKAIGKFHARALDKIGSFYYSEESFDDFYYGKGSTFPDINGGIGILFEQASSRGHVQESDNGLLTFPFTIRNQFTTALSTLEAAVSMREELLVYQHSFFKNARQEAQKESNKGIVFGDEKDAAKSFHLAEILKRHQIEVFKLTKDVKLNGKNFAENHSYYVPKNQKNTRLINAMFEKRTKFQDSLFYDISAWTFPLAFNLDYEENVSKPSSDMLSDLIELPKGGVDKSSDYAYLMEWHEYYTPKALHKILSANLRAKVAMKSFKSNGKHYDYGTILIPIQNQELSGAEIKLLLDRIATESYVNFSAVSTGLTEGVNLGSNEFKSLSKPNIAVLVGDGITSYDAGEIWHLMDTRYDINITKLDTRNLSRSDLTKYDVIIVANSNSLSKPNSDNLKKWVESGGTLIGYRNALRWMNTNEFIKLDFKTNSLTAKNINFEERRDFSGAQVIGGAIFEAKLDRSHPINFGYKNNNLALFRNTTLFIEADKQSYNNPIQYTSKPLLSGYISKPNLDSLANTVPFKVNRLQRGKVIVFTDNTNFRAFWYGTNKLLMNAVFFGKFM